MPTTRSADPDQAWLLTEFIRYIEDPKAGALDFEDMGPSWPSVRDGARQQTLRANDAETLAVVTRFDQLIAFCGMELSRRLGVHVSQRLSKSELEDQANRVGTQAAGLAKDGQLSGALLVPNAAVPVEITVDLRANRVDVKTTIPAPTDRRAQARVTWLLNQLKGAPATLQIVANVARMKSSGRSWRSRTRAGSKGHRRPAGRGHPLVHRHPEPASRHQARPGQGFVRQLGDLSGRRVLRGRRAAAQAVGASRTQAQGGAGRSRALRRPHRLHWRHWIDPPYAHHAGLSRRVSRRGGTD